MGKIVSEFYMNNMFQSDVIVVTHGTVAFGMVAAMTQKKNETLDDSLRKVHGCVSAGYYQLIPYFHKTDGLMWSTDFKCHSAALSPVFQLDGMEKTPVCRIPGPDIPLPG
jgi:hypothetical protein